MTIIKIAYVCIDSAKNKYKKDISFYPVAEYHGDKDGTNRIAITEGGIRIYNPYDILEESSTFLQCLVSRFPVDMGIDFITDAEILNKADFCDFLDSFTAKLQCSPCIGIAGIDTDYGEYAEYFKNAFIPLGKEILVNIAGIHTINLDIEDINAEYGTMYLKINNMAFSLTPELSTYISKVLPFSESLPEYQLAGFILNAIKRSNFILNNDKTKEELKSLESIYEKFSDEAKLLAELKLK